MRDGHLGNYRVGSWIGEGGMGTVSRVVVGVVGILIAVVVTDRDATTDAKTEEVAPPPEPPAAAVPDPTEDLVLPPLISRRVISNPPGARGSA